MANDVVTMSAIAPCPAGPRVVAFRRISHDTVRCLRELLARAERGEILGLSFAALQSDREFFLASCGQAYQDPAIGSALAGSLWYQTMKRVFGDD